MHHKLYPPYLGIAGISSADELKAIIDRLPEQLRNGKSPQIAPIQGEPTLHPGHSVQRGQPFLHKLAIGVLATAATLDGRSASKPKRYPSPKAWRDLSPPPNVGFTLLHYGFKSGSPDQALASIPLPGNFKGIQWNAPLDAVASKAHVEALAPWAGLRVVLQLRLEGEPDAAKLLSVARAHHARGTVTDLLLDASAGKGRAMNVEYVDGILKRFFGWFHDEIGIGVAGGLRPGAMEHVLAWKRLYPRLSVDIESGVRDEQDNFVPDAAVQYLAELVDS
jgi:hypothetical protein